MKEKAPVIAAIDVGTNSFHLVVASVNNRGILNIYSRDKEVVRLGSSGKDMKYIQPDAMERGIKTLEHFVALAQSYKCEIRAVATSAVREALNKDEFIAAVFNETGIEIEVISGPEEARLIYIGALHALPILEKNALVIDIGGGSTETVIGYHGEVKYVKSAKLGAIRLTKQFFNEDKTTEEEINLCRAYIKGEWFPIMKNLRETGFDTVVGTSGTIQNIATMVLTAKNERIPDVLNGLTIDQKDILDIIKKITKARTNKQRAEIPGIDPDRVDIILAGALILEYIIQALDIEKIIISSYALREGVVFDTVQKKEAIQEFKHLSHLRYETIRNLCHVYKVNMEHAEHIKKLSLQLFDDLQSLHKLSCIERELLEAASYLHDIGYTISHDQHHKHSYYIISQCIMPGFTNNEAEIIANIARYHRKSHPKKKHENFQNLTMEHKQAVMILAGILRIAEGIDRRQLQLVESVNAEINKNDIKMNLFPDKSKEISPDIELWGANRRKLLLEETLGKQINFSIVN